MGWTVGDDARACRTGLREQEIQLSTHLHHGECRDPNQSTDRGGGKVPSQRSANPNYAWSDFIGRFKQFSRLGPPARLIPHRNPADGQRWTTSPDALVGFTKPIHPAKYEGVHIFYPACASPAVGCEQFYTRGRSFAIPIQATYPDQANALWLIGLVGRAFQVGPITHSSVRWLSEGAGECDVHLCSLHGFAAVSPT